MEKYKYFFGCLHTVGGAAMKKLLMRYDSEYDIYNASDHSIENSAILTINQLNELLERRRGWNIDKEWDLVNSKEIKTVTMTDKDYPERLKNIAGLPYMLFYKGKLPDEDRPSVAIIGARMCSEYGKRMAKHFAEGLAERGIQIISGLASGIDGLSQKAAIDVGGDSYGILGSGIDICYPANNKELYERLQCKGGVISEFPIGTAPMATNFPKRNRIISGLSDIVLVIEAKPRSGTAITVSMALEQGRQVYAVPGRIDDALSQGCNSMIAEGAGIAYSVDCILEELGRMEVIKPKRKTEKSKKTEMVFQNDFEKNIFIKISEGNNNIEALASSLVGVTIQELQVAIMSMELKGLIKSNLGLYEV